MWKNRGSLPLPQFYRPAIIFTLSFTKRYMCIRQSVSDENLYLLTDARMEALDQSLSQLNLFDRTNRDAMWKFASDFQKDPYTSVFTAFSKITDKLIFR